MPIKKFGARPSFRATSAAVLLPVLDPLEPPLPPVAVVPPPELLPPDAFVPAAPPLPPVAFVAPAPTLPPPPSPPPCDEPAEPLAPPEPLEPLEPSSPSSSSTTLHPPAARRATESARRADPKERCMSGLLLETRRRREVPRGGRVDCAKHKRMQCRARLRKRASERWRGTFPCSSSSTPYSRCCRSRPCRPHRY